MIVDCHSVIGLVMFSDLEEMNQALAEMDRHPLLCKDDRAPTGLTSVARYILQVHRADVSDALFDRLATLNAIDRY